MSSPFDPAAIYALLGQSVTHHPAVGEAVVGMAAFDRPTKEILSGGILGTELSIRYPTATFPGVKRNDTFTIEGQTYTARSAPEALHVDGLEQTVSLKAS